MIQMLRISVIVWICFVMGYTPQTPVQKHHPDRADSGEHLRLQLSAYQSDAILLLNEEAKEEQGFNEKSRFQSLKSAPNQNPHRFFQPFFIDHLNSWFHAHKTLVPIYIRGRALLC